MAMNLIGCDREQVFLMPPSLWGGAMKLVRDQDPPSAEPKRFTGRVTLRTRLNEQRLAGNASGHGAVHRWGTNALAPASRRRSALRPKREGMGAEERRGSSADPGRRRCLRGPPARSIGTARNLATALSI
jgi:hypothetical protein